MLPRRGEWVAQGGPHRGESSEGNRDRLASTTLSAHRPSLQRDGSLIIPSMIPTQEVLQNLDRYSGIEKNYSRAHREQDEAAENDNDSDHDIPLGQQQYSNSTVSNYDSSPIPPSPTPLIPSRLLQRPPSTVQGKAVHFIVQEPQRTLKSPGRPASRNSTTASSRPMGLRGDERRLEDLDPIMDFDDSDDDLGLMDSSRLEKEKKKDADSIVSTFPRDSISVFSSPPAAKAGQSRSSPRETSYPRSTLGPPESPSRHFIIPTITPSVPRMVPPSSPSKRLRPISELPRPIASPSFLQVQKSPSRRGAAATVSGSPSRRQSKMRRIAMSPDVATTASGASSTRSPTRRVTAIARSFRNLQPPAPLGPRLLELAEEARSDRIQDLDNAWHRVSELPKQKEAGKSVQQTRGKRKRPTMNNVLIQSDSNDNDDGSKFAQQFVDPPLESVHWPTSPLYSGPSPPRQESPPETSLESLSSSQLTPSSSLAVNLKKEILLAEVEAIRNNETAQSSSLARAFHTAMGEAIAPSSSKTAAAAAIPSPTFTTLARIKKEEPLTPELLLDDANTTATQVAIAAPILALDDSIAEIPMANVSSALDLSDSAIEPQALGAPVSLRASPPPPPPQLSVHLHQTQELFEVPQVLPLPSLIAEYTPKLTPIDEIKWPPAKAGRFHIFALVLSIGPEEQITTKTGQGLEKRQLVVCDQSATSFKLELWRERCRWGDQIKIGDAILFTDVQVKEYRLKVTGNTSGWSKMSRLDGSVLSSYISDNNKLGSCLRIFMDKRQILALDLLDKDKGIARDPSFYLTQAVNSLPIQSALTSANFDAASNPPTYSPRAGRGPKGDELISLLSTASAGTLYGTKSNMPVSYGAGMALKSSALLVGPDFSRARPRLPVTVTGTSIRASVVYRMLTVPGDESQGWEIGAVMSNGRFLKIQTPGSASWINDTTPGKLFHFFGRFQDKSEIFQIEASSREPYSLSENAWGSSVKRIEPRHFTSIRSLREHKFMGDATLNGYILAVNFSELAVNSNNSEHDDTETVDKERNMFGFIQCYCTGCHSPAVSSPQNPAILFCSFCHLDPQKSNAPLEWMYPAFELSLGDRPQMDGGSEGERLQLRCQLEIGDQVFWSVPARRWMQNEKEFWRSRRRWERLIELMNNEFKDNDISGGVDRAGEVNLEGLPTAKGGKDMGVDRTRERGDVAGVEQVRGSEQESTELRMRQRLSVEVRVGINMVTKALKVEYL